MSTPLAKTLQQQAETGIQTRSPLQTIGEYLQSRHGDIARALPKHMTADRLLRITMTLIEATPKLLQCSTASIVGGVLQAAQLGLEPGLLGECYLVPYWHSKQQCFEAQFQVGYRGFIKLAHQADKISTFEAAIVYERDGFDFQKGSAPRLSHRPHLGSDRGKPIAAYAVVRLPGGDSQFEVLSMDDIAKVRASSKAADDGPWVNWWDEMAKKTAAKRLAKYLPLSPVLARALAADETTKTEIAEDMSNVVDATDWHTDTTPQAKPQESSTAGSDDGAPPVEHHAETDPQEPRVRSSKPSGERQFPHAERPPQSNGNPVSERQKGMLMGRAKAALGEEYKTLLADFLLRHALPDVEALSSNQASWVIDELGTPAHTPAPSSASSAPAQRRETVAPAEDDGFWPLSDV